jgi:hypothetical protein
MAKGIGAASDFYRMRVTRVTEADAPEFEWREDILYRDPPIVGESQEVVHHRIEAVAVDDDENVTVIGVFDSMEDATEALDSASEDLGELTRSEFEDRYFPA